MKPNHEIASHLGQLLWHHASTTASSNCGMVSISKAGGLGLVLSGQLLCNAHYQMVLSDRAKGEVRSDGLMD
jgi:hypothetical protein